ncbi:phospholipase A2 inhibitor NAI-like [Mantella aurantiaca]
MQLYIVAVFFIIVCTSEALQCPHCLERNSDHCSSEDTIDCGESAGCGAASGFFQNGLEKTQFIYKGCRLPIECNAWLCISMNGTYLQSYITCCNNSMCNLDYYIPSDEHEEYNGKSCPSCYSEGTAEEILTGCHSTQTQQCRGDETLCVNYRGIIKKTGGAETAVSFKGCANPSAHEHLEFFYGFQETLREFFLAT